MSTFKSGWARAGSRVRGTHGHHMRLLKQLEKDQCWRGRERLSIIDVAKAVSCVSSAERSRDRIM
jgi:hypothetical protein